MKKDILSRYDRNEKDEIIIKISTSKFENLYNHFDMSSTFLKKDLNQQLVDYIIESVSEISNEKFILKFYFEEKIAQNDISKIKTSVNNYFTYLEELEKKKMSEQVKNSLIFMLIGAFFITLSILSEENEELIQRIISEGPTGVFYKQFGITLIVAILISAINALTLSPVLCSLFLKPQHHDKEYEEKTTMGKFFHRFNAGFKASTDRYGRAFVYLISVYRDWETDRKSVV